MMYGGMAHSNTLDRRMGRRIYIYIYIYISCVRPPLRILELLVASFFAPDARGRKGGYRDLSGSVGRSANLAVVVVLVVVVTIVVAVVVAVWRGRRRRHRRRGRRRRRRCCHRRRRRLSMDNDDGRYDDDDEAIVVVVVFAGRPVEVCGKVSGESPLVGKNI